MAVWVYMMSMGVLGALVGVLSAFGAPYLFSFGALAQKDGWATARAIGDESANPYLRAWAARHGIWALPRREAIYFSAEVDADGQLLQGNCSYRIDGGSLPTRWWSVAAYRNDLWMDNSADKYSINSQEFQSDDIWSASFGVAPSDAVWLPSDGKRGEVVFVLRLYDPDETLIADPLAITLPTITREGCS